ncbi:MAG TPA: hypothetical protein VNX28_05000, partial [Gemmataceae bacterium]|nr:hypothetical protein [Gemmataceae bacterium]
KERKLQTADIMGVIAICGVYRIPAGKYAFALGGSGPDGLGLNTMAPLRGASGSGLLGSAGLPMSLNVFGPAFGDDPRVRADASPVNHVRKGLPPFLLFSAEHDLPMLPAMADEFHKALRANGCDAQLRKIEARNHNSIMFLAIDVNDPVGKGIVDFVRKHGD